MSLSNLPPGWIVCQRWDRARARLPYGHPQTCSDLHWSQCPRQDSNLRHRLYQSVVFDGSPWLSLAVVAQGINATTLADDCRQFPPILGHKHRINDGLIQIDALSDPAESIER
jgi:hypothetical protein